MLAQSPRAKYHSYSLHVLWAPSLSPASDGSLRFGTGADSDDYLALPRMSVDNGSTYKLILHARDAYKRNYLREAAIKTTWYLYPPGHGSGSTTSTDSVLSVGAHPDSNASEFNRYEILLKKPTGSYDHLQVQISMASSTHATMIDDIAVWESDAPCPDSDLDLTAPTSIDPGPVICHWQPGQPTEYEFFLELENRGCRDITVYSVTTVDGTTAADSLSTTKTIPFMLAKSASTRFKLKGTVSGQCEAGERHFYMDIAYGPNGGTPTRITRVTISYTLDDWES